ncbi:restriction endonuclease [Virgibacillus sp. MG-45]|uniref:restriction endonuclease n=1 Tax=Virgibacillus sp. MG-45 TaxID=3102791 RepID=UPI002ED8FD9D
MFIPTKENYTNMTPQDFEKFVMDLIYRASEGQRNIAVRHNEIIKTNEGEFQIDGTIRFEIMGVKYLTLVECKMYKSPVSREKVQILFDKLRATGAQKGILVTTSYFQSGAIDYAASHGVALVQIIDGKLTYNVRSRYVEKINYPDDLPKYAGIAQYKVNKNTIGCSNVMGTDFLAEFIFSN